MHIEYINHLHNKLHDRTIKARVYYLQIAYRKSKIFPVLLNFYK